MPEIKDTKQELRDCPFCGSDLIDVESSIQMQQTNIKCTDCWVSLSFKCCEEEAIEAWNIRNPDLLKYKEAVDKAEKVLPKEKEIAKGEWIDRITYERKTTFNQYRTLAVPIVAKLTKEVEDWKACKKRYQDKLGEYVAKTEELEEQLKTAQLDAYGEALKKEELVEALKNFTELIENCIKDKEAPKLIIKHYAYQQAKQALAKYEDKHK